jgi:hypothetical protein
MIHSTVDITGNNKEMKLMSSTVVKKDTARSCIICRGSRRSEINTETIMSQSTVGITVDMGFAKICDDKAGLSS